MNRLFEVKKFQLGKAVEIEGKKFRLSRVTPSNGTITLMVASIFDSRKNLVGGFVRKQYDEYGQVWDKGADLPDAEEPEKPDIRPGEMGRQVHASGPCAKATDFPKPVEERPGLLASVFGVFK